MKKNLFLVLALSLLSPLCIAHANQNEQAIQQQDQQPSLQSGQQADSQPGQQADSKTGLRFSLEGSTLISLISLTFSSTLVYKKFFGLRKDVNTLNKTPNNLSRDRDLNKEVESLNKSVESLKLDLELEKSKRKNKEGDSSSPKFISQVVPEPITSTQAIPTSTAPKQSSLKIASITISGLIDAINSGERNQLRDAASAQLNITRDAENEIAMGFSRATELEEVAGGGSYLLVLLDNQHLLFPTDRTLRGFANVQPAKGLFKYEQQTIPKPQLIEPAELEPNGSRWRVKTIGKIATP